LGRPVRNAATVTLRVGWCLAILVIGCASADGDLRSTRHAPDTEAPTRHPRYAAGELIFKLKEAAGQQLEAALAEGRTPEQTGVLWFDALAAQYGITEIRPLFRPLADPEAIARQFPERARRAPPGATVPDLRYIYHLTFQGDTETLEVVSAFANQPDVVYAEPNYIATTHVGD